RRAPAAVVGGAAAGAGRRAAPAGAADVDAALGGQAAAGRRPGPRPSGRRRPGVPLRRLRRPPHRVPPLRLLLEAEGLLAGRGLRLLPPVPRGREEAEAEGQDRRHPCLAGGAQLMSAGHAAGDRLHSRHCVA
ncbi:unnamed protein product, partial [Prorocentrum cordatum]